MTPNRRHNSGRVHPSGCAPVAFGHEYSTAPTPRAPRAGPLPRPSEHSRTHATRDPRAVPGPRPRAAAGPRPGAPAGLRSRGPGGPGAVFRSPRRALGAECPRRGTSTHRRPHRAVGAGAMKGDPGSSRSRRGLWILRSLRLVGHQPIDLAHLVDRQPRQIGRRDTRKRGRPAHPATPWRRPPQGRLSPLQELRRPSHLAVRRPLTCPSKGSVPKPSLRRGLGGSAPPRRPAGLAVGGGAEDLIGRRAIPGALALDPFCVSSNIGRALLA